ncbi:MAG: ATP-grasp domain-containing protein [Candidatus Riflemargulisbacteria bacterium]
MSPPLKRAVLLHQQIVDPKAQDQIDTLIQIDNVDKALISLGYVTLIKEFSPENTEMLFMDIKGFNPDFVFNLVEMEGRFLHLAPTLLEFYNVAYSGCSSAATYTTTNKVLAKVLLRQFGLTTADWYELTPFVDASNLLNKQVIVKSTVEDASINIDDFSVRIFETKEELESFIISRNMQFSDNFFAEEYIDGREFNVSIIGSTENPMVLPIAEIKFVNFPPDKAKIVSYSAKWDESTFEYQNTVRSFSFKPADAKLLENLKKISLKCWYIFKLNGYARVDFRVDKNNMPYILEVNANPGIAEDSGFVASSTENGWTYSQMVEQIINNIKAPK